MNRLWGLRGTEGLYVTAVGCLAVLGGVRGTGLPYGVAILLTLPCAILAVVGIYGGYALLKAVGGLWMPVTRGDGSDAAWLSAGSATLNAVLLVAAALANVFLIELFRRRRRRLAQG
ncbi:hypothetical protein [Streptomyces sp. NBC_01198]|uniref:hypothetical protein n=1 Tax=Streptomyces sp. NBC_01198 TaxID=2903769 RepID=UPI002E0E5013|nr:hypothetical protein OG702_34665 [Streptomyces sp. NBC_01198]